MEIMEFRCIGAKAERTVRGSVVVDYEGDRVLGVEVLGFSFLSGRVPNVQCLHWLKNKVISYSYDSDSDTLSLQVNFGNNHGQKSVEAVFELDSEDQLVGLSLPVHVMSPRELT